MGNNALVAIIGGGITGLAAAYELHRRGTPFVLFERANRLGGVIHTEFTEGFTIDGGPDSFLTQKPAAVELCSELGLQERLISTLPPRTAYICRAGQLYPLPKQSVLGIPTRLKSFASMPILSASGKIRMAMDLIKTGASRHHDESVGSFFRRRFGQESVAYIAEPLLAGIHAGDVDRLSMRALFPTLVDAERSYGSVIKGLHFRQNSRPPSQGGLFRSLVGGIGELTSAIVDTLSTLTLRTNTEVTQITGGAPFRVHLASGETILANQVILTTPAYRTEQLISAIDPTLSNICGAIPYTSTATVVLSYPKTSVSHPLGGTGFVVPRVETGLSLMAASWISSKWPHRVPPGQILLRGFLGGPRQPDVLEQSDQELVSTVHRDLSRLLGISSKPVITSVFRWPRVNPQHEVGHLERISSIDDRLRDIPGLHIVGAGFRGVGIPDCVSHGRAAGSCAAELLKPSA